jgi:hypothetical protein
MFPLCAHCAGLTPDAVTEIAEEPNLVRHIIDGEALPPSYAGKWVMTV